MQESYSLWMIGRESRAEIRGIQTNEENKVKEIGSSLLPHGLERGGISECTPIQRGVRQGMNSGNTFPVYPSRATAPESKISLQDLLCLANNSSNSTVTANQVYIYIHAVVGDLS